MAAISQPVPPIGVSSEPPGPSPKPGVGPSKKIRTYVKPEVEGKEKGSLARLQGVQSGLAKAKGMLGGDNARLNKRIARNDKRIANYDSDKDAM